MILGIFNFLIAIIMKMVELILYPIDTIIATALPSTASALTATATYLTYVAQGIGWAISASGIPNSALILLALFGIFKITVPVQIWAIKTAITWYRFLKG